MINSHALFVAPLFIFKRLRVRENTLLLVPTYEPELWLYKPLRRMLPPTPCDYTPPHVPQFSSFSPKKCLPQNLHLSFPLTSEEPTSWGSWDNYSVCYVMRRATQSLTTTLWFIHLKFPPTGSGTLVLLFTWWLLSVLRPKFPQNDFQITKFRTTTSVLT